MAEIDVTSVLRCDWSDKGLNRLFSEAFADGVKAMLSLSSLGVNLERRQIELRFDGELIMTTPFAEAEVWPEGDDETDERDWQIGIATVQVV